MRFKSAGFASETSCRKVGNCEFWVVETRFCRILLMSVGFLSVREGFFVTENYWAFLGWGVPH